MHKSQERNQDIIENQDNMPNPKITNLLVMDDNESNQEELPKK